MGDELYLPVTGTSFFSPAGNAQPRRITAILKSGKVTDPDLRADLWSRGDISFRLSGKTIRR